MREMRSKAAANRKEIGEGVERHQGGGAQVRNERRAARQRDHHQEPVHGHDGIDMPGLRGAEQVQGRDGCHCSPAHQVVHRHDPAAAEAGHRIAQGGEGEGRPEEPEGRNGQDAAVSAQVESHGRESSTEIFGPYAQVICGRC